MPHFNVDCPIDDCSNEITIEYTPNGIDDVTGCLTHYGPHASDYDAISKLIDSHEHDLYLDEMDRRVDHYRDRNY